MSSVVSAENVNVNMFPRVGGYGSGRCGTVLVEVGRYGASCEVIHLPPPTPQIAEIQHGTIKRTKPRPISPLSRTVCPAGARARWDTVPGHPKFSTLKLKPIR